MTARPPCPSRESFGFQFSVLARQWRRRLEHCLEAAGLSDATWAPLVHLQELGDGITQKELAALLGTDGSSLVRLLDILAHKGFIERRVDAADRRARLIFLTDAGRGAVRDIRRVLRGAEAEMLADLSDAEMDLLTAALGRVATRLRMIQGAP
ncbi:MarR family winged helix-turn-helix transcriptional regulator [Roseomonas marmotae]|uniref:MarR family transcriptional regulator n=1 Tax=Roseomonas marmotae TaxID=2768161 RepID=A0ABS3KAS6_9PROT|nr:MarR family transcriptional regulator [Roseomonas marmotae]MBO1074542.1 MarR family transcriptional regulator [Roseomonas marmotae]QTI81575.1 MarR family transcriptional regulator [Roseomonas marmotae]